MGTNLFDVILSPAFMAFTALAAVAAILVLLLAKKRGKKLPIGRKTFLIFIPALTVAYLIFILALTLLFDSAPPAPLHSINPKTGISKII